uniref:Serpin-Z12 n=1 Tax=Elaeis guineensis var. tenera TaxID=51953 RepID=A0A6I9Q8S9_ELAGV|nr:putative serpin-Z12 [Elaeis guineensis]
MSGRASVTVSVSIGTLQSLQESLEQQVMQLPSRRKPTITFKVVLKSKQRSLAIEAVIPKVSKGAQKLKKVGGGRDIYTRGYQGMFQQPSMFHEATIEVDEEGTSAAAATEIAIMAGSSLSEYMDAMDFHADHPFAFVIREEVTGSLLFFGHVVNPSLVDQD